MTIRFGTDGWRAVIGDGFTFSAVRRVAGATASYLRETAGAGPLSAVVGYDRRFASDHFARAVAEELAARGIDVHLCSAPAPTPLVSYATRHLGASAAVVVTASHNLPLFSGVKLKSSCGAPASRAVTRRIEDILASGDEEARSGQPGQIRELDPFPAYAERLGRLVNLERIRAAGLTIAADALFGTAAGLLPRIVGGDATQVVEINTAHNPLFPGLTGPDPVEQNLTRLKKIVTDGGAHFGAAFDGDADRIGVVDETGAYLSSQHLFALLTRYVLDVRGETRPVVKSITGSVMIDALAERAGVPVIETATGFAHVAEAMIDESAAIGGEESGGFAFGFHLPDRDGLLAALLLADYIVGSGQRLSELAAQLEADIGSWAYRRLDLPLSTAARRAVAECWRTLDWPSSLAGLNVSRITPLDGVWVEFADGGWLLARLSETEPVLRIYVELRDPDSLDPVIAGAREVLGL